MANVGVIYLYVSNKFMVAHNNEIVNIDRSDFIQGLVVAIRVSLDVSSVWFRITS